jgi:hypothetical protein
MLGNQPERVSVRFPRRTVEPGANALRLMENRLIETL